MDPDATLRDLRKALQGWYGNGSAIDLQEVASTAEYLIEWLDKGGALPTCWQRVDETR